MQKFDYGFYKESASYILERIKEKPQIAIVLGSSLGTLAEEIEDKVVIAYKDIPNFLLSTAPSHAGKMVFGKLAGKNVVAMSGRFHYYEGYSFEQLAAPVRVFKLIGVQTLILTNAAGSVNTSYAPGDIMLIKDHLNFALAAPTRGKNIEEFGPRFFDISDMYTAKLRKIALACALRCGQQARVQEGVYMYFTGPQFETPAEIRAARLLGADNVGMSTVTEALTAAHCNMQVLGLSLVTNFAAGVLPQPITVEEVGAAAQEAELRFKALINEIVKEV